MRRTFLLFLAVIAALAPAAARDAHPAFWTVHGPKATIYLISSLHLLPPRTDWHRPDIDTAMRSADSFVFEVPTGAGERDEETRFIIDNGLLPPGETLSSKLDPSGLQDYRHACRLAGMDERNIDQKRPWLAEVVLTVQAMYRNHYSAEHTPEAEAHDFATLNGKEIRYLDTTREQLEFLAGADKSPDVTQLRAVLADFPNQEQRESNFVDAWAAGDITRTATLVATGLKTLPDEQKLLDERNRAWAAKFQSMLQENRTFFVAVGIAHLVGPNGVPALLRAAGVSVDGP